MRQYTVVIVALGVCLWASIVAAQADSGVVPVPYIYRMKLDDCQFEPVARRQTGFRVQGSVGIVTALHGIADCRTVSAVADDGVTFTDLVIVAVDIERDMALLTGGELEALPADGLVPFALPTSEILTTTLRIVGYPIGLDKQDVDSIERVRDIESLDDIIPDPEPADFKQRQSPALTIDVLNLQAQLLPGHSGAPLLDHENRVAAVGDGGLRDGTINRSWAIPWQDIRWQPTTNASVLAELTRLAQTDPVLALAFSSTYQAIEQQTDRQKTLSGRIVDSNQVAIAGAEVTLSLENGYQVDFTDSDGRYDFSVREDDIAFLREILVEKTGYSKRNQKVTQLLPPVVQLAEIALPKLVALEPEQYLLVTFALPLKREPLMTGILVSNISIGELIQIIGGPDTEGEETWWQVKHSRSGNTGWIRPSDAKNVFVVPIVQLFTDDYVVLGTSDRRPLYTAFNNRKTPATMILPDEKLVILDGPREADGYLWYEVRREGDSVIGWIKFAGYGKIYLQLLPGQVPTATPIPTPTSTPTSIPTATLTVIDTPTSVPTLPEPATPTPQRLTILQIGDFVEALPSLRLRAFPGLRHAILESTKQKELFIVTDGPIVADAYTWWELGELNSTVRGWAAYFEDDDEFTLTLAPYQTPTPPSTPLTTAAVPTIAAATPARAPTNPATALIEILDPKWSESRQGWQTVRWRYIGELQPGQGFDLILWYILEDRRRGIIDAKAIAEKLERHANNEYSVLVNFSAAAAAEQFCDAKYLLAVTVVELDPYKRIGPQSDAVQIQVAPLPGGPC